MDTKAHKGNEERIAEEYLSSLSDLNCNSKPLINMLTMLADENIEYAPVIVKVVEQHISKVSPDFKLPVMYLIDSIVKNVKGTYVQLFSQCIVNIFCGVFETVAEKIRERLYALRQTWNDVFSAHKLYALDVKVKRMDNNWPITAKQAQPAIHVNPNFLKTVNAAQALPTEMEEILHAKTKELLELKKRKLELELQATMKHLEEQEKQLSKVSESVMAPVDNMGAAKALSTAVQPQVIPQPIVPSSLVLGQRQIHTGPVPGVGAAMRPVIFNPNFRNPRPTHQQQQHVAPGVGSVQQQPQLYPIASNMNKTKVSPVNPALLNSMRHRDPRIARQHQHQQHIQTSRGGSQTNMSRSASSNGKSSKSEEKSSSPYRNKTSRQNDGVEGSSENKGATRHNSSSSSRSSSKSSSGREKEKDRRRHESKSSGSNSSDRRKHGSSSREKQSTNSVKCDKDAFEIAPLSSTIQRNSQSPADSPSKAKESSSKRSSRPFRSYSRNKNRSPSSSPDVAESCKDVDLRKLNFSNTPDKRVRLCDSDERNDERRSTESTKDLDKTHTAVKRTDSPLSSNATLLNANTGISAIPDHINININTDDINLESILVDSDGDSKKRPSTTAEVDEPLHKKSKSDRIDTLFGTEDVDLRTTLPHQLLSNQKQIVGAVVATPPPPMISQDGKRSASPDEDFIKLNELDKAKKAASQNQNMKSNQRKTLDDVRAKLAKAAKYNKLEKYEKSSKDFAERFKLTHANTNEDSQEASDENLCTIIAQAQELFESNSINRDQCRQIVQTAMSINETNKLKEAKRRESLNSLRGKNTFEDEDVDMEAERLAARDAILKKRIPKLPKDQSIGNEKKSLNSPHPAEETNADNSPLREDRNDRNNSNEDKNSYKMKGSKEKYGKGSKWNDRPDSTNASSPNSQPSHRQWQSGMPNKRGGGAYRGSVPPPPIPPVQNQNHRLTQMPWQMHMPGQFVNPLPLMNGNIPPPPQPPNGLNIPNMPNLTVPDVSSLVKKTCNSMDNPQENMQRTVTVDGVAKEIRFYDQIAVIFMESDQPREISFKPGQRSICIDNQEPINLKFNDDYRPYMIGGETHQVRFGFPSRELYIDEHWYEIYFGGPAVSIPVRNSVHILKAEGPPPQVNIGAIRRDLVVGKINMIVDAHVIIPLFLDAKVQTFFLGPREHTIQFADNLLTVLLDGEETSVEYGGLPKSYTLGSTKYFVRFGALPQGIIAGKVQIKDMIYVRIQPPESVKRDVSLNSPTGSLENISDNESTTSGARVEKKIDDAEVNTLDATLSTATTEATADTESKIPMNALNNINIDELFQKLVSSGILSSTTQTLAEEPTPAVAIAPKDETKTTEIVSPVEEEEIPEAIRPIDLSKPESIKTRQSAVVYTLFSGMQCSSCGVRFSLGETVKYHQHLDWHFRQNRCERDSSRKARSRKWYYDRTNWEQYEEIEDLERREKNFFETQKNDLDSFDDGSNQRSLCSPIPTCAAGPDDVDRICDMCQEKFEQFYNEELEEWHLRAAIRVEDKIYHPLCYEDYKASLNPVKPQEDKAEETTEKVVIADDDNAVDCEVPPVTDIENGTLVSVGDDDDDDVIMVPNEEPAVTEIDDDDEEYVPTPVAPVTEEEKKEAVAETNAINETIESDVEIHEPVIPFTDLDTYVEKDLSENADASNMSFMNIKIKEEPKDEEEDDDDGFEDVGTVMILPEAEISVTSSEETQNHVIDDQISNSAVTIVSTPTSVEPETVESVDAENTNPPTVSFSNEGNLESEDDHNLSSTVAAPAINMASLVNKIKINITKNTTTNSSSGASTTTNTTNTTIAHSSNSIESNACSTETHSLSNTSAVSNIPVLCSGSTTTINLGDTSNITGGSIPSVIGGNVSNISVIGSYGASSSRYRPHLPPVAAARPPTPPIEDTIKYDLKPALQKATLKKTKKIECGVETSGLCSIM